MKVLILETTAAATKRVAGIIADFVVRKPRAVLGLATGGTMLAVYAHLIAMHQKGLSFANVSSFNLDEYVGLEDTHPGSYHTYMRAALFDHIDIQLERCALPRGAAIDVAAEAQEYEARIAAAGGIDIQLLGIGENGHIGFNEPTSSLGSRTRIKTLTESTRQANKIYFERDEEVPKYAITMGVATISDAHECVLLATGAKKAKAVAAMIEGPVSALCPASVLQMHANTTVVLDRDAASQLSLRDYYTYVHPEGGDDAIA